jgi:hypothetical protein
MKILQYKTILLCVHWYEALLKIHFTVETIWVPTILIVTDFFLHLEGRTVLRAVGEVKMTVVEAGI